MKYTAQEKFECADRELRKRKQVYRNRVETGRMTPFQAQREIGLMEEIREDYDKARERERLL